jgi:hypothetical protein
MTRAEIELLQCALDKIGAGLDQIADLVCAIETKAAKRKPATPKKKSKTKAK